jgi:hypothetical protein
VVKKHDAFRRSASLRLVLLATLAACGAEQTHPTAVDHRQTTPLANESAPAAPDPLRCTGYPEQRIWLESQAWWSEDGISIPDRVGHHIHVGLCWPVADDGGDALITSDQLHVDARVVLHDAPNVTQFIRVSDAGSVKVRTSLVIGPGNAEAWVPFDLDLRQWGTGRREFRWTARIPRPKPNINEMFNSTGWQLCVRSCSPLYRRGPFTEARGYYTGHDYSNARFVSKLPVAPVSGLWTFTVKLEKAGPGGVFVDPDFHNGSAGTVIRPTGGPFLGTVTIDTQLLTNGYHRLVLVSSDGQSAGVLVIAFTVENPEPAPPPDPEPAPPPDPEPAPPPDPEPTPPPDPDPAPPPDPDPAPPPNR